MLISIFDKLPKEKATPEYLGGKGHGLWYMQQLGVNVPPALIIPTTACTLYMKDAKACMTAVKEQLPDIRKFFTDKFGYMPLLSVRSGARVSMPGMMDTVLNVGLDTSTYDEWKARIGEQAAADSYGRLHMMFGNVVKNIERKELEGKSLLDIMQRYQRKNGGKTLPKADDQILEAIEAVFNSWNNERAKVYRKMNNIPEDWGTAVVLQAMVFGNMNDQSCTGVLFTRNPDSGLAKITGEFLVNAQGEDVVAGIRTPTPLSQMDDWNSEVAQELHDTVLKLEADRRDVQDVEFTVQDGKLFILQTRNAKRSARAAVKIALDMLTEGMINREEALKRVSGRELDLAQMAQIATTFKEPPAYTGIPACSGIAVGEVVYTSAEAVEAAKNGKKVVLVTDETTPDDIAGMQAAVGVLTMTGGSTSHAAVVARSMNKCCVVGLGVSKSDLAWGTKITLDGSTGNIWNGEVPMVAGTSPEVQAFTEILLAGSKLVVSEFEQAKFGVMLDLSQHFLLPDEQLVGKIKALPKGVELFVDQQSMTFKAVIGTFMTEEEVAERLGTLQALCKTAGIELVIPVTPKIEVLVAQSIAGVKRMVLSETDDPAVKKVLEWMLRDGLEAVQIDVPGSYLSHSKAVELLK